MTWLSPFIRSRKTKSNFLDSRENDASVDEEKINSNEMPVSRDEVNQSGEEIDDSESLFNQEYFASSPIQSTRPNEYEVSLKRKEDLLANKKKKLEKTTTEAKVNYCQVFPCIFRAEKQTVAPVPKTEDEVFGYMVTMQMKKLHGVFKAQAQHEINNTIFRFIMAQENAKASSFGTFDPTINLISTQSSGRSSNCQSASTASTLTTPTSSLPENRNFGWVSLLNTENKF